MVKKKMCGEKARNLSSSLPKPTLITFHPHKLLPADLSGGEGPNGKRLRNLDRLSVSNPRPPFFEVDKWYAEGVMVK